MHSMFRIGCSRFVASAGLVAICFCAAPLATAQELLLPASRDEIADRERLSSWTLDKFPAQPFMKEIYWGRNAQELPAFFRDSLVQYVARTYYMNRDNFDGTKSQAYAAGGWLAIRSGLIGDLFGVHAAFYGSEKIFGPPDQDGTKLLAPGQNNINTLGQIYGRIQLGDQEIRGGRQLVDTPLINPQDNRMVPNTFEAATLVSLPDKDRLYDYALGYIWNIKPRDSNDFISMSNALAGTGTEGTPFGMMRLRPIPGLVLTAMDYNVQNFINSGFGQAEYDFRQPKGMPNFILGGNVIAQASVGDNLLTGNSFETYQASAKAQMAYAGWTLFVAGSATGNQSKIYSPFGTKPNYTDMQQVSFDNAGEKAIGGSAAYDFAAFGLPGLSTGAWYSQGWGALNPLTNVAIPDRRELDVWLQYRPTEGPLKGLRLKTQYSNAWQQGNLRPTQQEFRLIADYTVLFRPEPSVSKQ
ncbi:OprD family porin [Bradyrhizobium sp. WYCCWR 13023]|uniref:OprD family porin n=1 Tax=Bradyrhizobium zhengyangense TaxID=2911009 RepID=A0A9X1R4C2_9BRAD|nr:OprD family outer membrane porin [Bradyrhizobium zhengyangense]MCG2625211.1 OprD family porin [Bradyrhizobium zhengyangense]